MNFGIQTRKSRYSVDETVARLERLLQERGVRLFCQIDHSAEAAAVGLKMPKTRVLIFGNPKYGTPVMLSAPAVALDLPSRILVSEMADGTTQLSWNDAEWLQQRYGFSRELIENFAFASLLAANAAE